MRHADIRSKGATHVCSHVVGGVARGLTTFTDQVLAATLTCEMAALQQSSLPQDVEQKHSYVSFKF